MFSNNGYCNGGRVWYFGAAHEVNTTTTKSKFRRLVKFLFIKLLFLVSTIILAQRIFCRKVSTNLRA